MGDKLYYQKDVLIRHIRINLLYAFTCSHRPLGTSGNASDLFAWVGSLRLGPQSPFQGQTQSEWVEVFH